MLPREVQRRLATRYGGAGLVKEAFDQNVVKGFAVEFADEREEHAAVVMVDIASFSSFVAGWSVEKIRAFLDDYYKQVMPVLFKYGGMIDRVAGDGILAVFSSFFTGKSDAEMNRGALRAAENIVAKLAGSFHSSKAALSSGNLVFCKTGVAEVYEEHTVIGAPITAAYRIEDIAKENQVVVHATPGFSAIIDAQLAARKAKELHSFISGEDPGAVRWTVASREEDLRGVGATKIYVQSLQPG